jgi:hypothetical protein
MKIRLTLLFSLLIAITIFSSGCKEKGCTDKNALNFNSVATEDDGSCILCHEQLDSLGSISDDLYDYNSNGPHYTDRVAMFFVKQVKKKFTYTECGDNQCYLLIYCQSFVPEKMTINWSVQGSGNVSFNRSNNATIQGFQIVEVDSIPSINLGNPCGFIASTSLFVSTFGNIIYN